MSLPEEQHQTCRLCWQKFIWILKPSLLVLHVLISEQAQIFLSYAYCLGSLFSVTPLNPLLSSSQQKIPAFSRATEKLSLDINERSQVYHFSGDWATSNDYRRA